MKHLFITLSFVFALVSCGTDTSVEQKDNTATKTEETSVDPEETKTDPEDGGYTNSPDIHRADIYILYVDENRKSVFDPAGKNWSKEDIKIFYHIEGKGTYPKDADRDPEGIIILDDYTASPFVASSNREKEDSFYTFPENPWLKLHPSNFLDPLVGFKTVLVTCPDQTTDTIRYQIEEYNFMRKVWLNGELKYDAYSEEHYYNYENKIFVTFSDGTRAFPNGVMWETVK
jgi:hypothetical protein